ncbi:MAG: ABC transporter permease [Anaerolineae bacterium]|nr:ABC transporter permease [Anaerolineae bacterium]
MFRIFDRWSFTLERIWQHRILVLWAMVGISAATTLALSLVLYIDAVNTGLLTAQLGDPPYAFRFRYLGSWEGNITRADVESAAAGIHQGFKSTIGLPTLGEVDYVRGGAWNIRRADNVPLGAFGLGVLTGAADQIEIVDGVWPPLTPTGADADAAPLPVMLPEAMLYQMGVQVGDKLNAMRSGGQPLTLEVVALWRAVNSKDPAWIFTPKFFDNVLLTTPEHFWSAMEGTERPVEEAAWYLNFDGGTIRTSDVDALLSRIVDGERDIMAVLPGIREPDVSPETGLRAFSAEVAALTQQLIIVILPVAGVVLYFVSLVAELLVSRQQQADVTLRSRGMSRGAILSVHLLMWLILVGASLVVGLVVSSYIVRLVGQTSSFLRFDLGGPPLEVTFTPQAIAAGAVTGLIAASSGLMIAWRITRQTITSFKTDIARAKRAWWQRMYLDILLFIPAAYVLFTLTQQGGLAVEAEDPFSDPLVFLGPTLFSLSLTLLFLRLWPFLLRIGAAVMTYTHNITLLMALRELSRGIGRYRGTLLMMCFTLSLTGFTASMASTLDRSLIDSVDYKIGADAVIVTASDAQTERGEVDETTGQQTYEVTGFNAPPTEDLLDADGVWQVARVGRYPAQLNLPGRRLDGTFLGVDRAAMAAVTRFRTDYADEHIADLFNRLAGQYRNGIVVNRQVAVDHNLRIGQEVSLQVNALNAWYELKAPIVDVIDYFPTLDPRNGFFAIGNLDPVFEAVGTNLPFNIWLALTGEVSPEIVHQEAQAMGFPVLEWRDPATALREARSAPSRRGVLGFLSVGFVAAISLTLIGAIIQITASFRAQSTQLGAMRAMGLSGLSVAVYMIILQGTAAASGILSGTTIGVATPLLFLPLLDFSGGLPPYLVRVAWSEIIIVYTAIGSVLFGVTLLTTIFLGRERVASILRMGDV